ncbi:MAG TPA: hypothetical protein VHU22_08650 [Xanthobacteraceae bacterium]|jgi:hypothetical protein|nr:hypothetical protein [Xanthobacteraceae bacterium]
MVHDQLQCVSRRFSFGMSALETFVRVRQYKDRAAEFFELAAQPFSDEVRARYLAIADHYMELADFEIRTDRLGRQKRLEQMRAEREKSQRAEIDPVTHLKADPAEAPRAPEAAKPPIIKSAKRPAQRGSTGGAQMAAQADFSAVKSAP